MYFDLSTLTSGIMHFDLSTLTFAAAPRNAAGSAVPAGATVAAASETASVRLQTGDRKPSGIPGQINSQIVAFVPRTRGSPSQGEYSLA